MNITVNITSGTSPGPYNIYYDVVDNTHLLSSNVSYASLSSGVTLDVPDSALVLIVVNINSVCETQKVYYFPTTTTTTTSTTTTTTTTAFLCGVSGSAVIVYPTTSTTSTTTVAPTTTTTTSTTTSTTTVADYVLNVVPSAATPSFPDAYGTITVNNAPVSVTIYAFSGFTPGGSSEGTINISGPGLSGIVTIGTPTANYDGFSATTTSASIDLPSNGVYTVESMTISAVGSSGNEVYLS